MLVPYFGTFVPYLCIVKTKGGIFMKNTDFTLESLSSMFSSSDSFNAIAGIISDLDLELVDVETV